MVMITDQILKKKNIFSWNHKENNYMYNDWMIIKKDDCGINTYEFLQNENFES